MKKLILVLFCLTLFGCATPKVEKEKVGGVVIGKVICIEQVSNGIIIKTEHYTTILRYWIDINILDIEIGDIMSIWWDYDINNDNEYIKIGRTQEYYEIVYGETERNYGKLYKCEEN